MATYRSDPVHIKPKCSPCDFADEVVRRKVESHRQRVSARQLQRGIGWHYGDSPIKNARN